MAARTGTNDTRLREIVTQVSERAGFDLEDLTVIAAGRRRLVRVVIDGDDGVGLDAAAEVSRAISAVLDEDEANDPTGSAPYTLEVTSPGIGRPLTAPRHFRRARTRLLSITRTDGSTLQGRVAGADDEVVHLLTGRTGLDPLTVPLADIGRAVVEVEFSPLPAAVAQALGVTPADPVDLTDDPDGDLDDDLDDDADGDDADDEADDDEPVGGLDDGAADLEPTQTVPAGTPDQQEQTR
ncbi:ribosome maturation factor RimP [Nakamurella flavida]|uniref:Ribosome maturation factor RimP n=1 Tax=Nakamurella flavida TaxID=363630 RepID=A0A939BYT7_9ACTN|nr:ribosome maturation factor RimP [Nakamurella flavida]MBM9475033.1 ribosome maturation factor RimP [Nakamurella flavida]MDP9776602.1 ribosome maturation factor RimP [Nakamurella flavida]